MKSEKIFIYGRHAVYSAILNSGRKINKIFLKENDLLLKRRVELLLKNCNRQINTKTVKNIFFEKLFTKKIKHQGLVAEVYQKKIFNYTEILNHNNFKTGVILDSITDINNIGAIYRSAKAFGIDFIISSTKNSFTENSALLNIACGAFETVSSFSANNISNAIKELILENWWIIGLDHQANKTIRQTLHQMKAEDKIIFVLGSEGKGIRRLIKKNCNFLAKIPNVPDANSINVSNAAAVAFYENFTKNFT